MTESERAEPALPEPREETAAAAVPGLGLLVLGGFDAAGASRAEVFRYDGAWHREPSLPVGLDHPAAATLDGVAYVAGGFTAGRASRRVFALPGNRELAPLNHARGALALVAAGGRLYAIGGNDGTAQVAAVEEFDPATGRWSDVASLPLPRNHLAGFSVGGLACAAGGRSPNLSAVSCYDPSSKRWREQPPLPAPTSGAGAAALGELVVVAGGEDAQESQLVNVVAVLAEGAWHTRPMLLPRHGFALAEYGGRLWACGGGSRAGLQPVADCTSLAG